MDHLGSLAKCASAREWGAWAEDSSYERKKGSREVGAADVSARFPQTALLQFWLATGKQLVTVTESFGNRSLSGADWSAAASYHDVSLCDGFRMAAQHARLHIYRGPASESRQRTESRDVGLLVQQVLWGFGDRRWCSVCMLRGALWGEPIANGQRRPG